MKNKKIFIALIIMLIFVSILSLNAFAEDVDYNTIIGINESGENNFYSLEGASGNSRWQDYINYHNSLHSDSPFGVINNLVTYKGYFLRNKTGVLVYANDNVIVASGCVYNVESIFVVENNTFKFNELIGSNITFANLLENIKQTLFTVDYSTQRSMLYYDSMPLLMNGGYVDLSLFINTDIVYTLGSACVHNWRIEKTIESANCIKNGSAEVLCIYCGVREVVDTLADPDYGHSWESINYVAPSCLKFGTEKLKCVYCQKNSEISYEPLGHKHNGATCTEDSYCIRCGLKVQSALDHDLDWRGQCSRCDHKEDLFNNWLHDEAIPGINNIGQNIINGWNGTVVPNLQNAGEAISNGLKNSGEKLEEFGTNLYEFFFPGEDGKGFGKNTGIIGDGNDNDDDDDSSPSLEEIWKVIKWVLFIIPLIFVGFLVIKYSIKIKREVDKNKTEKKGK